MRDKILLRQLQSLPLDSKITMSEQRIMEWYEHFNGNVCISFSGGKDSTVLTHLVHGIYPDVPLVFANTGLEYPEIQKFARDMGAEFVRPKMSFSEVISTYGYPIISKEVAEAIYFARRIVYKDDEKTNAVCDETRDSNEQSNPSNGQILRYERKRTELNGNRDDTQRIAARQNRMAESEHSLSDKYTSEIGNVMHDAKQLHGRTGWRRANLTGQTPIQSRHQNDVTETNESAFAPTDWHDWRRKSLAGVEEGYTGNSQFNKKKWLPLCQESQFMISHQCCSVMKKGPMGLYQRRTRLKPYIGSLAEESRVRTQAWIRHGCNSFDGKQTSQPLSLWTEQDILHYIKRFNVPICSVYGEILAVDSMGMFYDPIPGIQCNLKCTGCQRTGCVFCGFGCHLEKGETRFQMLAKTHPKQYEYCMGGGQWVDNPKYDPSAPKYDGDWTNWNPKKIWVPSKEGLGMKHVFDECNKIYGKDFIRYD